MHDKGAKLALLFSIVVVIFMSYKHGRTQETNSRARSAYRRWNLALYLGFASGGPAGNIEALMTSAGFDKTNEQPFGLPGSEDHPYSLTGLDFQSGAPWMVGMHYVLKPPFAIGVLAGQTPIGTTFGYHSEPDLDLSVRYSVGVLAPLFAVQAADVVRLGVGPALYYPKTGTTSLDTNDQSQLSSQFGFLLDFGLTLPSKSHAFFELRLQYRSVGKVTIGPIKRGSITSRTLPAGTVNYDHWLFSLGFGVGI